MTSPNKTTDSATEDSCSLAHVLFGKPVPTFPGHALESHSNASRPEEHIVLGVVERRCGAGDDLGGKQRVVVDLVVAGGALDVPIAKALRDEVLERELRLDTRGEEAEVAGVASQ